MAQFRTGRFQATVPLNVAVIGPVTEGTEVTASNRKTAICRNDFVVFTPAASGKPASIEKATAAQVTARTATHIVALTDQTIGGPERIAISNDTVSELVGATGTSLATTTPTKKVGLYPIWDWNDIIPDADGADVKA